MLPWLVENFDAGSCMFTVSSGKEFVVTRNDVCDVFCLPMGDIPVPELKKNAEVASVDNCIIQGPLDTSTYPLSQSAISQTDIKKPLTLGSDQCGLVGGASSSGTIGHFVQFELPDGVMTDDEIK
uniref:Uncharacterized protein n=1 Tax=Chenopodium quinoa TaxID=63459 RepID=A0A803M7X9_CHEQI